MHNEDLYDFSVDDIVRIETHGKHQLSIKSVQPLVSSEATNKRKKQS